METGNKFGTTYSYSECICECVKFYYFTLHIKTNIMKINLLVYIQYDKIITGDSMSEFDDLLKFISDENSEEKEDETLDDSFVQNMFNGVPVQISKKITISGIDESYIRNVSYINDEAIIDFNTTPETNEYINILNVINLMKQKNIML